jgi:ADP-ribose pyrophosphatase YjhB (NUDIX family)
VTPRTTVYVAAVVMQEERILLVRQSPGHPLEGQWTVPWGRLEAGESPLDAALRETWEEGGVRAEVRGFVGLQELPEPLAGGVALVYLCQHLSGDPEPRDTETDAARYFSFGELGALDEPIEPWSDWLAARMFAGDFTMIRPAPTNPLRARGAFF